MSSKIPTPRQIQRHNEHHTQKTTSRNTSVTSPRFTKTRSQLKPQPNMSMVLKMGMAKPSRQTKTTQDPIQDSLVNRIKRLNNINNKNMNMGASSPSKNLLKIQRRCISGLHRHTTTPSTEDRIRNPRSKPPFKLTHPSRCPDTINDREHTERSLAKKSSITISLGNHGNVSVQ